MRVTPEGGAPKKGVPRQVPRLPPLEHTTGHDKRFLSLAQMDKLYHELK